MTIDYRFSCVKNLDIFFNIQLIVSNNRIVVVVVNKMSFIEGFEAKDNMMFEAIGVSDSKTQIGFKLPVLNSDEVDLIKFVIFNTVKKKPLDTHFELLGKPRSVKTIIRLCSRFLLCF